MTSRTELLKILVDDMAKDGDRKLAKIKNLVIECLDTHRDGFTDETANRSLVKCLQDIELIIDQ